MNKVELHKSIMNDMHDLYVRKNNDYGDSVHETYVKFGSTAFLVRMSDKLNRLCRLTDGAKDAQVSDESIMDTCMDLANYAVLMYMELFLENSGKEGK